MRTLARIRVAFPAIATLAVAMVAFTPSTVEATVANRAPFRLAKRAARQEPRPAKNGIQFESQNCSSSPFLQTGALLTSLSDALSNPGAPIFFPEISVLVSLPWSPQGLAGYPEPFGRARFLPSRSFPGPATSARQSAAAGSLPKGVRKPPRNGISTGRTALWSGGSIAAMVGAYRQSQASWGESNGKFHFKDDFKGDGMAMNDEASHLFAAYRLTQVLDAGYRWIGMSQGAARRLAAAEAWLWTFAVEFPIDAYNPSQGFGVSDLLFNTAGVLAAYHRSARAAPRWDVKISVKPQFFDGSSRVIAYTDKQYDDYVYWLTIRPSRNRYIPILFGAGYSTTHGANRSVTKELHLGVGTSLEEIGALLGERTARYLKPLNFFFFNLGGKITWR